MPPNPHPTPTQPQAPTSADAPTRRRARPSPRPRKAPAGGSLRQRLILWSIIAVIVPAFACAVAMNYLGYRGMANAHLVATQQLAKTLAGALQGRLDQGFGRDARAVIDRLREDPRVALVEVTDPTGRILYRPTSEPIAFSEQSRAQLIRTPDSAGEGVVVLSDHFALCRVPVFRGDTSDAPSIAGYLTLAVHDRDGLAALWTIHLLQFGAAAAVCLVMVPLTMWVVARWTAPLSSLRQALAQMGRGQVPAPIRANRRDDLGRLCDAFDAMVHSLVEAQKSITQSNARLEHQVTQRTAELRHLNDKLEAEGNDKNEFLRAVSHDLNAPLRNIGGMAQMLLMKYKAELPDDAVSKLERIAANAKHQGELIADLLELSRLRTKEIRPEVVEVDTLLRRIIENLEYDLGQAKITLTLRGKLPVIWAEKNRIRQVLQNLLDNAIKYMMDAEERKITVSVKRTRDFEPDVFHGLDVWQFSVADTGRGIAAEDVDKVFQVFARATHSGTHMVAGRGVGLASVKTIVEQYGGRIWVESTLGLGSTFTFTLPVDRVAVPNAAAVTDANNQDRNHADGPSDNAGRDNAKAA